MEEIHKINESLNTSSSNRSFEYYIFFALTLFAFGYFFYRLIFFATHISHYIPPDEITHLGICQVYSKADFLPEITPETYHLGVIVHSPCLYYFIMGKFLKLNFFLMPDLVFLRLLNCIFSCITVLYGYKWIKLITANRICHILFLFLITDTPMFSFVSASVNYDNLTNLFAVTAIYCLHLFFKNRSSKAFLLFWISLLAGALTKISFLPLVAGYIGILIYHERKNLKDTFPVLKKTLTTLFSGEKVLTGIAFILLVLNLVFYGNNLIQFRKIIPSLDQVLTEEQAMQNRIYARNRVVTLYRAGKITFEEAVQKADNIQHTGDRDTALYLLKLADKNLSNPAPLIDPVQYSWLWLKIMLERSAGIAGHIFMLKNPYEISAYQLFFLLSFLCFVRYWLPVTENRLTESFFLCIFYGIILMQLVSYSAYKQMLSVGIGLQGRYFFPVLVPFYGIVSYFLVNPFKKPLQAAICLSVSVFFIWGDFPYFLQHATPVWFFR